MELIIDEFKDIVLNLWNASKKRKFKWELHDVTIFFIDTNELVMEEIKISKSFYKNIIKPAVVQNFFKEDK